MSFDLLTLEQKKPLHSLLLTMEQEVEARKDRNNEYGVMPYFEVSFQQGNQKMTLLGVKHTSQIEKGNADLEVYKKMNPDIVLHEGNNIHAAFSELSDDEIRELDPQTILLKGQESLYVAWQAFKDGKTVQSWDVPFKEQLSAMAKIHSHEAIAGWIITQSLGKLYEKKMAPTEESLKMLLPFVLSSADVDALYAEGIDLKIPALERACEKYLGMSLEQLNQRFSDENLRKEDDNAFHRFFDPAYEGETNRVLRDMNTLRDEHAIDVMEKAKGKYSNILCIAGGSHVRTWRPAVAESYRNEEASMRYETGVDEANKTALQKRRKDWRQKQKNNIADARQIAQGLKDK